MKNIETIESFHDKNELKMREYLLTKTDVPILNDLLTKQ